MDLDIPKDYISLNGKTEFTVEEYFEFDDNQPEKYEFYNGRIYQLHPDGPQTGKPLDLSHLLKKREEDCDG